MKLWKLQLRTFRGTAPGAVHHYATLFCNGVEHRIEYELTESDIKLFQQGDLRSYHRLGEGCGQFWSKTDAREAAVAAYKALSEPQDLLVTGDNYGTYPGEPLAGNPELFVIASQIRKEYKDHKREHGDRKHGHIFDKWDKEIVSKFDQEKNYNADSIYVTMRKTEEDEYEFVESWS